MMLFRDWFRKRSRGFVHVRADFRCFWCSGFAFVVHALRFGVLLHASSLFGVLAFLRWHPRFDSALASALR
ncbi:hypothetical protein BCAR13_1940001 [Paraburkholderia caribensis]|nr:hypothetical protein BCAR13_1940001 [Paraburkholderia caribensis]